MGGGPGFRVHQFGGNRPRRRPRDTNEPDPSQTPPGVASLSQFLPLLLLFILPFLSNLFSSTSPSTPSFKLHTPDPPHTLQRMTPKLKLKYFLNPTDIEDYSPRKLHQLDQRIEVDYVANLRRECQSEINYRDRLVQDAQGWFFPDVEKMREAQDLELKSCAKLKALSS